MQLHFKMCAYFHVVERQSTHRDRGWGWERYLSSAASLLKCPQQPWLGRPKPGPWTSIQVSPSGCRKPSTWAALCCLLGCFSRQLQWKQRCWGLNWHSVYGTGIPGSSFTHRAIMPTSHATSFYINLSLCGWNMPTERQQPCFLMEGRFPWRV